MWARERAIEGAIEGRLALRPFGRGTIRETATGGGCLVECRALPWQTADIGSDLHFQLHSRPSLESQEGDEEDGAVEGVDGGDRGDADAVTFVGRSWVPPVTRRLGLSRGIGATAIDMRPPPDPPTAWPTASPGVKAAREGLFHHRGKEEKCDGGRRRRVA